MKFNPTFVKFHYQFYAIKKIKSFHQYHINARKNELKIAVKVD